MEVESVTTTETEVAAESEVDPVQITASNDADPGLSRDPVAESDVLITVDSDSAVTTTVNGSCMAVELDSQAVTPSSAGDEGAAESPGGPPTSDVGPSTPAATTSDCSVQQGSSLDSSTQWSGGSPSVDTVQSVPHPASSVLLEDDRPATTTTTEDHLHDREPLTAAEVVVEPPPSSNSQQQPQQPEQPPQEEDVQFQDFKAG